ncbi:hypothetical protein J7J90_02395 [Candidatus Micrarchaeota archaeon]|nr:hypothetical protein [Candidatus Micrarchaeota archaeon]
MAKLKTKEISNVKTEINHHLNDIIELESELKKIKDKMENTKSPILRIIEKSRIKAIENKENEHKEMIKELDNEICETYKINNNKPKRRRGEIKLVNRITISLNALLKNTIINLINFSIISPKN